MKTGKDKAFTIDPGQESSQTELAQGRGLYGGDVRRIPYERKGITPHVSFSRVPEVRRMVDSEEERKERDAFLHKVPLEVEIGFGKGAFLRDRAKRFPQKHFLGFEIHRNLCLHMAKRIHRDEISNLQICFEDCRHALPELLQPRSIDRIFVFFPDPWWTRKHVKRRLLTLAFLDLIDPFLTPDAIFSVKTDVMPYAEQVEQLFSADPRYQHQSELEPQVFAAFQPTEREAFCQQEGIPFRTFCFQYIAHKN
ncbi:MAG: tRNA (guanosine(46)-N7)-methyltransferase TrmB [Myxococcota bacterium]